MSGKDIINALNHEIRRKILQLLEGKSLSYTELLDTFKISTGKLNYHLKLLDGFISKNEEGLYENAPLGLKALRVLRDICGPLVKQEKDNETEGEIEKLELDEQALKVLNYIKEKIDSGDDERFCVSKDPLPPSNKRYLSNYKLRIKMSVLVLVGVLMLSIFIFSQIGKNESGNDDFIPHFLIWVLLGVIASVAIGLTFYRVYFLKKRKKIKMEEMGERK